MLHDLATAFAARAPAVDYWSLRLLDEHHVSLSVRQNVVQPAETLRDRGAMVSVVVDDGFGYAATPDLTPEGLRAAAMRARDWAQRTAGLGLLDAGQIPRATAHGRYESRVAHPWLGTPLSEKIDRLREASRALAIDERIVDWEAGIEHTYTEGLLTSSEGARIEQRFSYIAPHLVAVANQGATTQTRTLGVDAARQGGLEELDRLGFPGRARAVAEEAIALLDAPECPEGTVDVLLQPSQMVLQLHESVGHPLELDRILGDERNYAGTSFVTPDMFGHYRYGSELLNVTFDPEIPEELASYGFDDEGTPARRAYLIRDGVLERALGSATSQVRTDVPGVACARASGWNRPPVDRMANLNLEPGDHSFDELVGSIERGVVMETNRSWSIDDSRNKFQFGCELGHLIEDGEIKGLVRNPGYRGISATFWRNLAAVGDASTFEVRGVPTCGKGEPNQMLHAGHATPACVFRDVDVFGGA